jgi:hypothetical protein
MGVRIDFKTEKEAQEMKRTIHAHVVLTGVTGAVFGNFEQFHGFVSAIPGCAGISTIGLMTVGPRLPEILKPLLQPAWDAILDAKCHKSLPVLPTDAEDLMTIFSSYSPEQWAGFADEIKDVRFEVEWPKCLPGVDPRGAMDDYGKE